MDKYKNVHKFNDQHNMVRWYYDNIISYYYVIT